MDNKYKLIRQELEKNKNGEYTTKLFTLCLERAHTISQINLLKARLKSLNAEIEIEKEKENG